MRVSLGYAAPRDPDIGKMRTLYRSDYFAWRARLEGMFGCKA